METPATSPVMIAILSPYTATFCWLEFKWGYIIALTVLLTFSSVLYLQQYLLWCKIKFLCWISIVFHKSSKRLEAQRQGLLHFGTSPT